MGAMLTQRPDLINAAVIQVPLFDMLRFHKLLAGASWQGEYGDPDIPERARLDRGIFALPEPARRPALSRGLHPHLDQGRPRPPRPCPQGGGAAGGAGLSGPVLREHRRRPRGRRQPARDGPPHRAGIHLSDPPPDGRAGAGIDSQDYRSSPRKRGPSAFVEASAAGIELFLPLGGAGRPQDWVPAFAGMSGE